MHQSHAEKYPAIEDEDCTVQVLRLHQHSYDPLATCLLRISSTVISKVCIMLQTRYLSSFLFLGVVHYNNLNTASVIQKVERKVENATYLQVMITVVCPTRSVLNYFLRGDIPESICLTMVSYLAASSGLSLPGGAIECIVEGN